MKNATKTASVGTATVVITLISSKGVDLDFTINTIDSPSTGLKSIVNIVSIDRHDGGLLGAIFTHGLIDKFEYNMMSRFATRAYRAFTDADNMSRAELMEIYDEFENHYNGRIDDGKYNIRDGFNTDPTVDETESDDDVDTNDVPEFHYTAQDGVNLAYKLSVSQMFNDMSCEAMEKGDGNSAASLEHEADIYFQEALSLARLIVDTTPAIVNDGSYCK